MSGPAHPEAVKMRNARGDKEIDVVPVMIRCKGCGFAYRSVIFPWTPVFAKYKCRRCDYVTEVKTRDEAMDKIEEHIEEGYYEQKLEKRKTVDLGSLRSVQTKQLGKAYLIDP